jgi:hypothetical protein
MRDIVIKPLLLLKVCGNGGIAFIKDPDGYWIEIFDLKSIGTITAGAA